MLWAGCGDAAAPAPPQGGATEPVETTPAPSDPSGDPDLPSTSPAPGGRGGTRGRPRPDDPPDAEAPAPATGAVASDGEVPPAELGSGPCVLVVRLEDAATGAPLASSVRLWRLGVPSHGAWTAGDQVERRGIVPAEGATFRGLPHGRYRVEVDGAAPDGEDAPEFELGLRAEQVVRVAVPVPVPVTCSVVDETGTALRSARRRAAAGAWGAPTSRAKAAWAAPRRPSGAEPPPVAWSSMLTRGSGTASAEDLTAGAGGFDLGPVPAATRVLVVERADVLSFEGRNDVRVRVSSSAPPRAPLAAVAVPLAQLVAHVRRPGGGSVIDPAREVTAECDAVVAASPDAWRTAPVRVTVRAEGCAPLEFEWRAGDPPREPVELTPIERR